MRARVGISLLSFLLAAPTFGRAQVGSPEAVSLPFTRQHALHSRINGTDYRVLVALPVGYSSGQPADTARYPALYVLDGNDELPLASEALRLLRLDEINNPRRWAPYPDVVIVGIGYPVDRFSRTTGLRATDYTPTTDAAMDSLFTFRYGTPANTGRAATFLRVLREEVFPLIERTYRTTSDRGLMGHSFGGLFTAFALFEAPELFSRYAILSPSFWWDREVIVSREQAFSRGRTELPKRVFISVGALETPRMVRGMQQMVDSLRRRGYRGLDLQTQVFADEDHMSVSFVSMMRSFRALGYVPTPSALSPSP